MASRKPAPADNRKRRYSGDYRREEDREGSPDRTSHQENPEVTDRAGEPVNRVDDAPDFPDQPVENGEEGAPVEERSRGGSPPARRVEENGDAAEHKSPRYSDEDRASARGSRSPAPRRDSGINENDAEDRGGRRGRRDSSMNSRGSRQGRRSPRSPRGSGDRNRPRGGRSGSGERGGDDAERGPYT